MDEKNTRQQVLDVALRQFSKYGFLAVSIRDICKEVGIKESTVYYHFKNKQDILDSLVHEFEETINQMTGLLTSSFESILPGTIQDDDFLRVAKIHYSQFLNNERCYLFINMLMVEQRSNPQLGKLYARFMFDQPVETQSKFFSLLIQWGYLKNLPVKELAVAYQSIFFFCFSRQIAMEQSVQQAEDALEKHLLFFLEQYKEEEK